MQLRTSNVRLSAFQPGGFPVADYDYGEPLRINVLHGGARQVLGRQRQHLGHECREVVVGKIVERDLGDRAGDLFGGFEAARVSARQGRASELELLLGDRTIAADGLKLGNDLAHGVGGRVRLDAGVQDERPAAATEFETVRAP